MVRIKDELRTNWGRIGDGFLQFCSKEVLKYHIRSV
jgi:hypothetical protein